MNGPPSYNPGPSAPYAPSGQYGEYGQGPPAIEKNPYEGQRLKPKRRINDPIFLVLFIAQLAGYCVVSGLVLSEWISSGGLGGGVGGGTDGSNTGSSVTLNQHTAFLLLLVTGAALVFSVVQFMLTRMYTRAIMHITLILSIALNIGIAVYYWITKYYSGAIIFTVIALLSIFSYYGFKSHIKFSALLLQVVIDISKHHTSVFLVAFIALIIQAGLSVWYAFTVIATYAKYTPGNPTCNNGTACSSSKVAGLVIFDTFSYLWTSQVVGNVALATLAGGPYGAWYYYGPKGEGMPNSPTISSFIRASVFSLGSIAFGSLIVTILELLRLLCQIARSDPDNQDGLMVILACVAQCFITCIERIIEYFNRYAYIEIALYGKPYIEAAKNTFSLFKQRGINALVNDSLVSMTLTWGAYAVGMLCSLFGYIYLRSTHPDYNVDGQYTAPVILFAFLIGLQCSLTISSSIEAGVSTLFVGIAENPELLPIRCPALYEEIAIRHPHILQGVSRS